MKKILLLLVAIMLTLTIYANTNTNEEFNGRLTIMTQYLDGYHNVSLKWEDTSTRSEYYAYIITVGNSDNDTEVTNLLKEYPFS